MFHAFQFSWATLYSPRDSHGRIKRSGAAQVIGAF